MNMDVDFKLNYAYRHAKSSRKRYRVIYGGSGSGKSYFVAQEAILNMLENSEYRYLIVRQTGKSIRNSVFKVMCQLISEYNLSRFFKIRSTEMSISCITGSEMVTSGLDDVEKLKSIHGINRIWVEEASEISEKDFEQLDLRLRGKNKVGYQITLTFNPISELHWLKRRFFDVGGDDVFVLKTTYLDNHHLDKAYKAKLERLAEQDYQYYRIYALGEWGSTGNLIFTKWRKEDLKRKVDVGGTLVEFKRLFDNFRNGVDFGFADDPVAFTRLHIDKKNKRIYITDEIYQSGIHNDELAEMLFPIVNNEIVTCDSAEPKSIADLKRNRINAKGAKKGKDSIKFGIKFLQGYEIIIDESCVNTIREIGGYKWKEDKDGNVIPMPIEFNNHIIDAIRYALESDMTEANNQWGWK